MPELSEKSKETITEYLKKFNEIEGDYDQVNQSWRLTKYNVDGHFLEHHDR